MKITFCILLLIFSISCNEKTKSTVNKNNTDKADSLSINNETFRHDVSFMQRHKDIIVLEKDSMKLLIVPAYQARVMTSTAAGDDGLSYGWINYALIDSGKYVSHINAYGGEERFWMGPEGGQFALFFKKGQPFEFKNWQTPGIIDTAGFDLVEKDLQSARFIKSFEIQNYAGFTFSVKVNREISLLDLQTAEKILGISLAGIKWVGYQTNNSITNQGKDLDLSTGVLSIWLLCMLKSSENNQIIIPFKRGGEDQINDAYFGKVPADRLIKKDSILFMKADAKYRSKIGLPPSTVKPFAGSYDAKRNVLTILNFDFDPSKNLYVNSMWEMQKEPYKGDVVNAYNDGPNESGGQLGSFYELETSSPAIPLKKNQSVRHAQRIFHFEGSKEELNVIAKKILGVDLDSLF